MKFLYYCRQVLISYYVTYLNFIKIVCKSENVVKTYLDTFIIGLGNFTFNKYQVLKVSEISSLIKTTF